MTAVTTSPPYTDSQNPSLTVQEIQDTLFRTSEIYAPFNVEVSRLSGYGNIDQSNNGNTTILVGADAANYKNGVKFAYSHTNSDSVDYPGQQRGNWPNYGRDRPPNSDGYDVAFVDPVGATNSLSSPSAMSQAAAHEAGHTFGLAHVRTDGLSDPTQLGSGTVSDIMSYTDSNQYFANQMFPITTWNNTGTQTVLDPNEQPQWWHRKVLGVITEWDPVTTQNSFTYLQTVLGARPVETGYRVVHSGTVDSGVLSTYFPQADTLGIALDINKNGSISRLGDYDVSRWTAPRDETLEVTVSHTGAKTLVPILLVYDGNGNLIQFQNVNNLKTSLSVQSGKPYYFVVGAQDGNTTGTYHLEIAQETHDFFVTIDSINEHLHGTPQQNAAVTTQAHVQIDGQDAEVSWDGTNYFTMQPLARTANEGNVKFHITVTRSAPWKSELGTPVLQGGEWYVDFPDGSVGDTGLNIGEISDASQIPFGFKVKLVSAGPPGAKMGTVRTIDVTYDLASQTITGTADGNALSGKPNVPILSYGDGSTPDIAFTISMDTAAPVQKITWLAPCFCSGFSTLDLLALSGAAQGVVHKAQLPSGLYSGSTDDLGGSLLSLAAVTNTDGRTELFGIDARTHAVVHKRQVTPGGPFATDWANDLGGSLIALVVGQNTDGRLELFGIDAATHAVVHKWQTAASGTFTSTWTNDLGGTATALAVGKNADGRLELFAVDARTQAVIHKWQTAPGQPFTSAWASDLGGLVLQIAVGSNADGRLELFAIDARTRMVIHNRQLEPNSRFAPIWSNDLGGPVSAIAVGRGPDGLLNLFVTDLNKDQVVHKRQLQPNGPFALGWTDDLGDFSAPATQLGVGAEVSAPVAGTPFTITVVARGAHNDYATGYQGTIHFTSTDPLATLPADYTFTAADNGVHTFTIILRTAGAATVTVTDTARGSTIRGSLSRVVFPAAATHLGLDAVPSATAGAAFSFVAVAFDPFNNIAYGYSGTVHLTSSDSSATLPADYTFLPSDGGIHVFIRSTILRQAGRQTLTATDTVNRSITGSTAVSVAPASASHFNVSAPTGAGAGSAFTITVTAMDAYGNVATAYRGTVHFSSSDSRATLPANTTLSNGVATFRVTLETAGSQIVTATDMNVGTITGSATINVVAGALDHFAVASAADAGGTVAGSPFDVMVTAQDAYNNIATTYTGTITFSSQDPYSATLPANYTFTTGDAGVHTFAGGATLYTAGTWDVTATDPATGATGSDFIAVTAAPAVAFQVIAPTSATAGTAFDVTVVAVDPYGNTDTNYQGTVHFTTSDSDPGVVLPADYTFQPSDAGLVTFSAAAGNGVTLITLGDQTLTATDTTSGITGGATVTVTSGPNRAQGSGKRGSVALGVGAQNQAVLDALFASRREAWWDAGNGAEDGLLSLR